MSGRERREKLVKILTAIGKYAGRLNNLDDIGGAETLSDVCRKAAAEIREVDRARQMDIDEFMGCLKPCYIQHRKAETFCGWAMYGGQQHIMTRCWYVKLGLVMLSTDSYGKDWIALTNQPETAEEAVLWRV